MMGRLAALAAGLVAAVGAAGTAVWARRRADERATARRQRRAAAGKRRQMRDGARPEPAAAVQPSAAAQPAAVPESAALSSHSDSTGDMLQSLKGIGAVSADRLRASGVTTFAQIAAWDDEAIDTVAAQIKVSPERIRREDWVGQAQAAGRHPR